MTESAFDRLTQMQYVELAYGISAAVLFALILFLLFTSIRLRNKLNRLEARRSALRQARAANAEDSGGNHG